MSWETLATYNPTTRICTMKINGTAVMHARPVSVPFFGKNHLLKNVKKRYIMNDLYCPGHYLENTTEILQPKPGQPKFSWSSSRGWPNTKWPFNSSKSSTYVVDDPYTLKCDGSHIKVSKPEKGRAIFTCMK